MIDAKIMLFGFGGVGKSLFNLILQEKLFSVDNILVVDRSRRTARYFEGKGGSRENFFLFEMDSRCYTEILDKLRDGDFLIYLAVGNDNLTLAKECAERNIHFLCTTDDTFHDLPFNEPFRYRTHFYEYKELMENTKVLSICFFNNQSNTSIYFSITIRAYINFTFMSNYKS